MTDKSAILSFLDYYQLADAKSKPINNGLSSFAFMIAHKSKKYILKIYNKNSNIETEVQFGNYLHKEGVPTAKIIKNSKGRLISEIDGLSGALFEFCDGEPVKWGAISSAFSENLAVIAAKMHFLMLNNTQIPGKDYHGCEIGSAAGLSNIKIIQKSEEISDAVKNLVFSNLRQGLIHGDLTRQNILAAKDRNKVKAIIDFGDAHYDYLAWDLSVLITHIFITNTYGIDWKALSAFIKKYYSLFPLSKQDIDAIIPFMKIRNLNLAIEVNRLASDNNKNTKELISIENSVMEKLDIIKSNQKHLLESLKN